MKGKFLATILVLALLALTGCGDGGSSPPPLFVTDILSDPAFDGDIRQDPVTLALTVTQGFTQSLFAGIDPVTGAEFRAFLDFPLTGARGVPINAFIESATLDIFIDSILFQPLIGTIPVQIDLVSFQPPTLVATDFSTFAQPALLTTFIVPPISRADLGFHVPVDVTSLMVEAQRLGLANFQVRILLDLRARSLGLIEINESLINRAPLLTVTYFF